MKKILNHENDEKVRKDGKAQQIGLNIDGKKSTKRKVGSTSGTSLRVKKAKKIKDPNAPKRPVSAFMIFSTEKMSKEYLSDGLSFGEKVKEIGRRWQAMAPEEKEIYHERYQKLKIEFDNAMKDYETSKEFLETKKQSQGMKNAGGNPENEPFPDAAQYFGFVADNWMLAAQYLSSRNDSFGILDIEERSYHVRETAEQG